MYIVDYLFYRPMPSSGKPTAVYKYRIK